MSGRDGARKDLDDEASQGGAGRGALCYSALARLNAAMTPPHTEASPAESTPDTPRLDDVLAAPPPDVQSLLDSEASPLALYFDAQRALACAGSQRDWPQLWRLVRAAE